MKEKAISLITLLGTLIMFMVACSSNKGIPTDVEDIMEEIYHNMMSVESFRMESEMVLDMNMSNKNSLSKVGASLVVVQSPFAMYVHNLTNLDEEEVVSNEMYCVKEEDTYYIYSRMNESWAKNSIDSDSVAELSKDNKKPLDLDLYLTNLESFYIGEQTEMSTILIGTVAKENVLNILIKTNALAQLELTSIPDDMLANLSQIKLKMVVDNDTICITKFEVDMTDTFKDLIQLMFNEDSIVKPQINECKMIVDSIMINQDSEITVPNEVTSNVIR